MHTLNRRAIGFAAMLSALAGCVDAIGFIKLGGYFVAFMSGNSTQLAVGLAQLDVGRIVQLGSILLLFVGGTMLGALLGHGTSKGRGLRVLRLVAWLLACACLFHLAHWDFAAIILMVLAMGAENNVFQRDGDMVVGLTYMTGTLVKMGQKMAGALTGGDVWGWVPYGLLWLGLVSGATCGAALYGLFGLGSLWAVAAFAAAMMIYATIDRRVLTD
ncbi:MAG: YoaK family protein [Asticcacaulis sp.]|uniref:YoaK family protein n=1 Tax=Asticcacaulis sp. TaxID=1872648 RepID=UPI003F7BEB74